MRVRLRLRCDRRHREPAHEILRGSGVRIPRIQRSRMHWVTNFVHRLRGISGTVSRGLLFFVNASRWVPERMLPWMLEHSKRPELARLRHNRALVRELARDLVESKKREVKEGAIRGDIMSLLSMGNAFSMGLSRSAHHRPAVRSSASLKPDRRLSDDEIVYQVR